MRSFRRCARSNTANSSYTEISSGLHAFELMFDRSSRRVKKSEGNEDSSTLTGEENEEEKEVEVEEADPNNNFWTTAADDGQPVSDEKQRAIDCLKISSPRAEIFGPFSSFSSEAVRTSLFAVEAEGSSSSVFSSLSTFSSFFSSSSTLLVGLCLLLFSGKVEVEEVVFKIVK